MPAHFLTVLRGSGGAPRHAFFPTSGKKNSVLFLFVLYHSWRINREPTVPPSSASGFSGAARVQRLDLAGIASAEKHGKRLDWSSMQRHVRSVEPLVWPEPDGLDLMALYERHIADVFVPGGQTKMLHNIVQFPKDLISEDEPERMLEGARKFIESVYGPESVVAARIDQDEKGRHVVDVFVVPIYVKKTTHTSKRAVSISKHLKDLGKKHGLVDEYNQRVEEKNAIKSADRAGLRASLIRNKLENPLSLRSAQNGISDRSDLTRLFTRDRGNASRRSAVAVAGVQRLPERELAQDERNGVGVLVQRAERFGVQQQPLDRGMRYQVVSAEGERTAVVPDHTGKAARDRDPVGRKPVRAGAAGELITDPNLFMQGVALQSELHLFLRDEMGLEGVQRGRQKKAIGPDWQSPELLNIQRKREAVEAELAAKEAALAAKEAADLATNQAMQTVVELQLATGAQRSADAGALLAKAKDQEAQTAATKRQAEAFSAGVDAWGKGDLVPIEKDGVKSVKFRDAATKERLWPVIQPAIVQLWEWMSETAKTVAKAVADQARELLKAATVDRDQAAQDRAGAGAAKLEADRLLRDAVVKRELAARVMERAKAAEAEAVETKRQAGDLAVKATEYMADAMEDRDLAAQDRARASALTAPEALQRHLQAFATPERVAAAIDAKVTPEAVQKRLDALVTPGLVLDVLNGKVEAARAADSAVAAAHFLRGRGQGR